MPAGRAKRLVDLTDEQIALINVLATRQGTTFTAVVSEALNEYTLAHSTAMDPILDRLFVDHHDVIDRLSST